MHEKNSTHTHCLHHSHAECIRLVPIFNHLSDEMMDEIAGKAMRKEYKRGEFIYRAEEDDPALYIVNSGSIRIFRLSESGKEQLVRILHPGEFTGEWIIFGENEVHEEYAEAMKSVVVCMIQKSNIQEVLVENPSITLKLLSEISTRLNQSERQTANLASSSVVGRLVLFLEELVEPKQGSQQTITLPMAKKDIASYLGTTPETISRKFKELEEVGLIDQLPKSKIKINDLDALLLYSDN